jgi:Ni,Fe-hydrogenase III small subunit
MLKSIKIVFAAGACAALLVGVSAHAETVWKPPAEIAPKAAETGAAAPTAETAAPAAAPATPVSKADKEKSCSEQAAAKALKGKAKKQFKAECLKS